MRSLTINVARIQSSSPLWVGRGLLERLPTLIDLERYSSVVIVADSGASAALKRLTETLKTPNARILVLEGGERMKDSTGLQGVWEFFVAQRLDRRSLVITLGGGALSDLVGFAAATYMRGIAFMHLPTTLLAQVDASIGGKSGINFMGVKNLLGSIMQPIGIVVDIDTLATLPARELRSGFAEIIKHGLIADADYFESVTARAYSAHSPDQLVDIILRSCEIKKDIVEADETEQGVRKTLNFGHTIGHAIESYAISNKISLTHGEAISIGMLAESFISYKIAKITEATYLQIKHGITQAGLPTELPTKIPVTELRTALARDKKNVGNEIKWVLIDRIGKASFDLTVPEELVQEALLLIQPT